MFARALLAFLILPGMAAGVIPLIIFKLDPWKIAGWYSAVLLLGMGIIILFWCIRDFYVAGKGTLAPWDPPQKLVTIGLYKYSRNPMYIGVLLIVSGWGLLTGSFIIDVYTVLLGLAFYFRVTVYEEPWQENQFGEEWQNYTARVPRWFPGIKA